jgi:hypothetical protein
MSYRCEAERVMMAKISSVHPLAAGRDPRDAVFTRVNESTELCQARKRIEALEDALRAAIERMRQMERTREVKL